MAFLDELAPYGDRSEPDNRTPSLGEGERRASYCLMICVSRPCTDRLVLDL